MLLTREELQERLIALHQASLELVKNLSLETLLERIASLACSQAGARYAAVGVLDEEGKLKQFITIGMSSEEIKRIPHPPRGLGLIGALMHGEGNIRIPEISADARSAGFPKGHPEMRSMLGVPIRLGKHQLGQIYLTDKLEAPEFTRDDEMIIEMLASYAGVAIENVHLYERLKEHDQELSNRNEELALLNQINSAMFSSLELDEILNRTLALLMAHFQVEAGEIFLMEEDKESLRLTLHRGEAAEAFWSVNKFKVGEGMVGKVAETLLPLISNDPSVDTSLVRPAVVKAGFKQLACVPLTARGGVVGALTLARRNQRAFSEYDVQLLMSVGSGAGTAIENARLHYNARRLAVLEERDRIGMDLHDGVIQSIYGVGLALEHARTLVSEDPSGTEKKLNQAMEDLNRTIHDIRNYILDLRPRQLHGETLLDGLERLVVEFRQNNKIEVSLAGPKRELLGNLPPNNATALFHICQEALANIAKHSNAGKVNIDLWTTADRVLLEVGDNGKGFNLEVVSKTVGHGLSNMQDRVNAVGGDLDITSIQGEGTNILAWVPRDEPVAAGQGEVRIS